MNVTHPPLAPRAHTAGSAARRSQATRRPEQAGPAPQTRKNWLERLADWSDRHPSHHHLGSHLVGR